MILGVVRLALISDLHANLLALDAVLADIETKGPSEIVCLGDVATLGPKPREVLARVEALGCTCILGNHDDFLLRPGLIHTYTEAPIVRDAVSWCGRALDTAHIDFLRTFHDRLELNLGSTRVLLFHGTPGSHMQELVATSPEAEVDSFLEGHDADVFAGGHTHVQMIRQHRGRLIINPGSVGMPFERPVSGGPPVILPFAEYATIECSEQGTLSVALHRIPLSKQALREQAATAPKNPICADLVRQFS